MALDDVALDLPEVIYTDEGHKYLHLPGVIITENAEGETRYLLSDGLGSIRHVTDGAGEAVGYQAFDPYGNPIALGGEPYGYTGEWWQADVGLLHLRARWYDPSTGTFLSKDPFEGSAFVPQSMNGFNYVHGNPVNWTDPSGEVHPGLIALAIGGGAILLGVMLADDQGYLGREPRIRPLLNNSGSCEESLVDCERQNKLKRFEKERVWVSEEEFNQLLEEMYSQLHGKRTPPVMGNPSNLYSLGYLEGWYAGRHAFDTPFWDGGGRDIEVCVTGHGCYQRSHINYVAQGIWGAKSGESLPRTLKVINA